MSFQESWEKALKNTEIVRARVKPLQTHDLTQLPYIFLAESSLNYGDTVVRKGEIVIEKPSIILPQHLPQFEGFEFDKESPFQTDMLNAFFLVRGIRFPSMKYNNKTDSLDVYEGRLKKAVEHFGNVLQHKEDVNTGLVAGPEDCWQFSVLILTAAQILKQADGDIRKLLDEFRKDNQS